MSESEKIQDGYEIRIWFSQEDLPNLDVDEIFDKLEEFVSDNWDRHEPDEKCVIGWTMSGGPSYTTQAEIDEFNEWLASIQESEEDE